MIDTNRIKSIGRVILIFLCLFNSVTGFGEIKSKKIKVIDHLIQALKDDSTDIRKAAIEALKKIKSEKAIEPLILALKDEWLNVQKAAIDALIEIRSEKAVELLIKALSNRNENPYLRINAAFILGKIYSNEK